jgi:hypothetical protein
MNAPVLICRPPGARPDFKESVMQRLVGAHALIVGVGAYRPQIRPLPAVARKDAEAVYRALVDPAVGAYDAGNVRLLCDEQATAAALRSSLADLARVADGRATAFIYFSGHGGRLKTGPAVGDYLLPADAVYPDEAALAASALSAAEFTAALRAIRVRKLVVVLDCCHAGGIDEAKDFKGGLSGDTLCKAPGQDRCRRRRDLLRGRLPLEDVPSTHDAAGQFAKHLAQSPTGAKPA